jgi:hypothetical protein
LSVSPSAARITESKSIFKANKSCAAPARAECPEILFHSSGRNPIDCPTLRSTAVTICAVIGH